MQKLRILTKFWNFSWLSSFEYESENFFRISLWATAIDYRILEPKNRHQLSHIELTPINDPQTTTPTSLHSDIIS